MVELGILGGVTAARISRHAVSDTLLHYEIGRQCVTMEIHTTTTPKNIILPAPLQSADVGQSKPKEVRVEVPIPLESYPPSSSSSNSAPASNESAYSDEEIPEKLVISKVEEDFIYSNFQYTSKVMVSPLFNDDGEGNNLLFNVTCDLCDERVDTTPYIRCALQKKKRKGLICKPCFIRLDDKMKKIKANLHDNVSQSAPPKSILKGNLNAHGALVPVAPALPTRPPILNNPVLVDSSLREAYDINVTQEWCKDALSGYCAKGRLCGYRHPPRELKPYVTISKGMFDEPVGAPINNPDNPSIRTLHPKMEAWKYYYVPDLKIAGLEVDTLQGDQYNKMLVSPIGTYYNIGSKKAVRLLEPVVDLAKMWFLYSERDSKLAHFLVVKQKVYRVCSTILLTPDEVATHMLYATYLGWADRQALSTYSLVAENYIDLSIIKKTWDACPKWALALVSSLAIGSQCYTTLVNNSVSDREKNPRYSANICEGEDAMNVLHTIESKIPDVETQKMVSNVAQFIMNCVYAPLSEEVLKRTHKWVTPVFSVLELLITNIDYIFKFKRFSVTYFLYRSVIVVLHHLWAKMPLNMAITSHAMFNALTMYMPIVISRYVKGAVTADASLGGSRLSEFVLKQVYRCMIHVHRLYSNLLRLKKIEKLKNAVLFIVRIRLNMNKQKLCDAGETIIDRKSKFGIVEVVRQFEPTELLRVKPQEPLDRVVVNHSSPDESVVLDRMLLAGIGSGKYRPVLPSVSLEGVEASIKSRVVVQTQDPLKKFNDVVIALAENNISRFIRYPNGTRVGKIATVSVEHVLKNIGSSPVVLHKLREGSKVMMAEGISCNKKLSSSQVKRYAAMSCFTKKEKLMYKNHDDILHKAGRNITMLHPIGTILVSQFIMPFQGVLKKCWGKNNSIQLSSSRSPDELGRLLVQRSVNKIFSEDDASMWDVSLNNKGVDRSGRSWLIYLLKVFRRFGMPIASLQIISASFGISYFNNEVYVRITVRIRVGKNIKVAKYYSLMASGVPPTYIGNCIVKAAKRIFSKMYLLNYSLSKWCARTFILVCGDDDLEMMPREDLVDVTMVGKWLGYTSEHLLHLFLSDSSFCSMHVLSSSVGVRFTPKLGRVLIKGGYFIDPPKDASLSSYVRGYALSFWNSMSGVPIGREYISRLLELTDGVEPVKLKEYEDYKMLNARPASPTIETYEEMNRIYGIDYLMIESAISHIRTLELGDDMDHPVLDMIMDIDCDNHSNSMEPGTLSVKMVSGCSGWVRDLTQEGIEPNPGDGINLSDCNPDKVLILVNCPQGKIKVAITMDSQALVSIDELYALVATKVALETEQFYLCTNNTRLTSGSRYAFFDAQEINLMLRLMGGSSHGNKKHEKGVVVFEKRSTKKKKGTHKKASTKKKNSHKKKVGFPLVSATPQRKMGRGSRANVPTGCTTKRNQTIMEDEYICDVVSCTTFGSALSIGAGLYVNPGNAATFPWGARVAINYEEYDYGMLEFYIKRAVSELNSVGSTGKIMMMFDYDTVDVAPASKLVVEDNDPHVDGMPCDKTLRLKIDCQRIRKNDSKYILGGVVPSGSDPKTFHAGNLWVMGVGQSTAGIVMGELHVRYKVRCSKPALTTTSTSVQSIPQASFTCANDVHDNSHAVCGAITPGPMNDASISSYLVSAAGNQDIRVLFNTPGTYVATWVEAATAAGAFVPNAQPVVSAYSGITRLNNLFDIFNPFSIGGQGNGFVYSTTGSQFSQVFNNLVVFAVNAAGNYIQFRGGTAAAGSTLAATAVNLLITKWTTGSEIRVQPGIARVTHIPEYSEGLEPGGERFNALERRLEEELSKLRSIMGKLDSSSVRDTPSEYISIEQTTPVLRPIVCTKKE